MKRWLSLALLPLALTSTLARAAAEKIELYDSTLQDFVEWAAVMLNKSVVVGSDIRSAPISIFATFDGPQELEQLLENAVLSSGFHYSKSPNAIRISAQPIQESPVLVTEVIQLQQPAVRLCRTVRPRCAGLPR